MRKLYIDNYVIDTPIPDIIDQIKLRLTNGKLKDVQVKGDNILVTCPSHAGGREAKPAGNIYIGEDTGVAYGYFRCFVCDCQGPFYHFVAECFDSSDQYAKDWLCKTFGTLVFEKLDIGDDIKLPQRKVVTKKISDAPLKEMQSYCPYLAQRKISKDICELFGVKYDPKFRQVVFPVYDARDNLVMLAKRSIDSKIFYLDKDVEKPVYCLNYIIKNNITKAIITEGPFDCLTAYEYGAPAIATLGKLSEQQVAQINKSCLTTIYTMFDNDDAGREFTEYLKQRLDKRILVEEVKLPPNRKDLNELSYQEFIKIFEDRKK